MYTSRKVRRALQDLSDEEFTIFLDELDAETRAVVLDDAGRNDHAAELTRHFEETHSLGALVDVIRVVRPDVRF